MLAKVEPKRQLARFRGRSYVAFVFSPTVPVVEWLEEIDATLERSPGFFVGRPVVLDLGAVDLSASAIGHLIASLEARAIRVLGIEGVDEARLGPSLPPLLTVVALAVPPAPTFCSPPAKTLAPLAKPESSCSPPEISAPRSVPPAWTNSVPPLDSVVRSAAPEL